MKASKETISTITDRALDSMAEWRSRPLDSMYPVVFLDAIHVRIRDGQVANRPIYVAIAVTCDGYREILGLWAGDGAEGAKFWAAVLTDLRNRGVRDVLMLVCDGLPHLPEAWPRSGPRPWSSAGGSSPEGLDAVLLAAGLGRGRRRPQARLHRR